MKITIHEEKNSHFTFHGEKKGPITSHENTLYHPLSRGDGLLGEGTTDPNCHPVDKVREGAFPS